MKTIQRTFGIFLILFSVLVMPVQASGYDASNWMESISGEIKLNC